MLMKILVSIVGETGNDVACPPHHVTTKYIMWNQKYRRAKGHTHYRNVVDTMDSYELVILSDSDMDFNSFNCSLFMEKWNKYNPIISSPTLIGKGNEFSHEVWKSAGIKNDIMKSHWIEQNIVIFDAKFLRFYYNNELVQRILNLQIKNNIAWGLDWTWCGAAKEWDASRIACATINVPMVDKNTKTMGSKNKNFNLAGFNLLFQAGLRKQWCWSPKCCALHKWFYQAPYVHAVNKMKNVRGEWLPNDSFCTVNISSTRFTKPRVQLLNN